MKIKFTATDNFKVYDDRPVWQDGDVREIDDKRALDLVKSFPHNFAVVGREPEKAPPPPPRKSILGRDKSVKGAKDK